MAASARMCQTDIIIEDCIVFTDPYEEADEQLKKEREEEIERQKAEEAEKRKKANKKTDTGPKIFKQGIGKYINASAVKRVAQHEDEETAADSKKKKAGSYGFGDFSAW